MRALITGVSGAIGPRVVYTLQQRGYQIRGFSIDTLEPSTLTTDVEAIIGDITDPIAIQSAMQDVDIVIHMAALLHVTNPMDNNLSERSKQVNIVGTKRVTEAAMKTGVQRIVFFSTIAVYGSKGNHIFNEDSSPQPDTYYAQTKLAAEEIILSAKRADGEPIGTVLRLGAVYGSRIKGNYERMVSALARYHFIPIGDGRNRRTLVYDKDVAKATVLAMEHPVAAGRIYNVTDGTSHTMNEIILSICTALDRKPPRLSLPAAPARFAAGVLEKGAQLFGFHSPVTRATIDKYTENIIVKGSLIQKELGFSPRYDINAGWREAVKEMRARGVL